jgi:hypothetical protein
MHRGYWLVIAGFFLAAGCRGPSATPVAPDERQVAPVLKMTPPPGTYQARVLEVLVQAPTADFDLFLGIDSAAVTEPANAYPGALTVQLYGTSRLHIAMRAPDGTFWNYGPYQYKLEQDFPEGACSVMALPRDSFRDDEIITVGVTYARATALDEVNLKYDGAHLHRFATTPDQGHGSGIFELGPISEEGWHTLECEVSARFSTVGSTVVSFLIDGTPPSVSWAGQTGRILPRDWTGVFPVLATDMHSGVALVEVCNAGLTACLLVEHVEDDEYRFATVITRETDTIASLRVRVTDRVGWTTVSSPIGLELWGFANTVPFIREITTTTQSAWDLSAEVTGAVAQIFRVDGRIDASPLPWALQVFAGWNEWAYRSELDVDWSSFAIYGAGLSLAVPSLGEWLVYGSHSTLPAFQAFLLDRLSPLSMGWANPDFQIPHLFFILDEDGDGRWSSPDRLFRCAEDAWQGRWFTDGEPVQCTFVEVPMETESTTLHTVDIDCAECSGAGRLVVQQRATLASWPVSHTTFAPEVFPVQVTFAAEPGLLCVWWWDVSEHGAMEPNALRAFETCEATSVQLKSHGAGNFRLSDTQQEFLGMPYGGTVTGHVNFLDSMENVLLHISWPQNVDHAGHGRVGLSPPEVLNYTSGPVEGVWFSGGDSFAERHILAISQSSGQVWVRVTDQAGDDAPAVVWVAGAYRNHAVVVDSPGLTVVPLPEEAREIWAERAGFLSLLSKVDGESEYALRITHESLTGRVTGMLSSEFGAPVTAAEVVWESQLFRARTYTDAAGHYALPASGGAGILRVSFGESWPVVATYELEVTSATVVFNIAAPDPEGPRAGLGVIRFGSTPVHSAGSHFSLSDERYYSLAGTGLTGIHSIALGQLEHDTRLPGFLPAFSMPGNADSSPPTAWQLGGRSLRCGARHVEETGGAVLDAPCWTWSAQDGMEEYFLGILGGERGFPAAVGAAMSEFSVGMYTGDHLVLQDRLLSRTIRLRVTEGFAVGGVPYGVYDAFTAEGIRMHRNGEPATLHIPADARLTLDIP